MTMWPLQCTIRFVPMYSTFLANFLQSRGLDFGSDVPVFERGPAEGCGTKAILTIDRLVEQPEMCAGKVEFVLDRGTTVEDHR